MAMASEHTLVIPPVPVAQGTLECVSCGNALPYRETLPELFCPDPACQGELHRRRFGAPSPSKCRYCLATLNLPSGDLRVCNRPSCATAHRLAMRNAGHRREAAQFRRRLNRMLDGLQRDARQPLLLVLVPTVGDAVETVSSQRRVALKSHLQRVVAGEVPAMPTPPDASEVPEADTTVRKRLVGRACNTCRGFCCSRGANHAYIGVKTVRRVLARNPSLDPDDMIEAYLGRVPDQVSANSCIFHGVAGCTLPRNWRSETCNRYLCDEVKRLLAHPDPEGQCVVFGAYDRDAGSLDRLALSDADHGQALPLPDNAP